MPRFSDEYGPEDYAADLKADRRKELERAIKRRDARFDRMADAISHYYQAKRGSLVRKTMWPIIDAYEKILDEAVDSDEEAEEERTDPHKHYGVSRKDFV
jgi:hypothetical protein